GQEFGHGHGVYAYAQAAGGALAGGKQFGVGGVHFGQKHAGAAGKGLDGGGGCQAAAVAGEQGGFEDMLDFPKQLAGGGLGHVQGFGGAAQVGVAAKRVQQRQVAQSQAADQALEVGKLWHVAFQEGLGLLSAVAQQFLAVG